MATPIVSEEHCALLDAVQVYVDREWQRHGKFITNEVGFQACIAVDRSVCNTLTLHSYEVCILTDRSYIAA